MLIDVCDTGPTSIAISYMPGGAQQTLDIDPVLAHSLSTVNDADPTLI